MKLEFSQNWNNKLDCKCFTTIRIFDPAKHWKGNQFDLFLNKQPKGKAVVLGVLKTKLSNLTDYMCYLDTGYNTVETITIFKKMFSAIDFENKYISVLLLKKIDVLKPVQRSLFNN